MVGKFLKKRASLSIKRHWTNKVFFCLFNLKWWYDIYRSAVTCVLTLGQDQQKLSYDLVMPSRQLQSICWTIGDKTTQTGLFWSGLVMIKPSCLIGLCSNNKSSHSSPLYLLNDHLILVWINNLEKKLYFLSFISRMDLYLTDLIQIFFYFFFEDKWFIEHKHHGFVNITADCHTHTKIRGVLQRSVQCRVPQGWMRAALCHGKHLPFHSRTPLLPKFHVQPRSADPESPGALSSCRKRASSG